MKLAKLTYYAISLAILLSSCNSVHKSETLTGRYVFRTWGPGVNGKCYIKIKIDQNDQFKKIHSPSHTCMQGRFPREKVTGKVAFIDAVRIKVANDTLSIIDQSLFMNEHWQFKKVGGIRWFFPFLVKRQSFW